MVSQVYLFQWFIMFIYKIIWNCPLIMGTWSCCIDFGFRIQTRGFFWLAKKIQNFRFCSTRSKPNERSYHNKLPNLVTGFVKFIYRSNLLQSSSKYWYLGCIWTWGSVPFLAWNTRTRAKRFFANSFLRRNGWNHSTIFPYTSETAGTQFRPIRFPTPPLHLTLIFFQ